MSLLRKALDRILRRKLAYRRVFFNADGKLHNDADVVLTDLRRFCRATASTATLSPVSKSVDPLAMAMAEGRREVWLRIMAHLHLEERTVFNLTDPNDDE
jgi:hypothetical protein